MVAVQATELTHAAFPCLADKGMHASYLKNMHSKSVSSFILRSLSFHALKATSGARQAPGRGMSR